MEEAFPEQHSAFPAQFFLIVKILEKGLDSFG
jgi:hypothetical protein